MAFNQRRFEEIVNKLRLYTPRKVNNAFGGVLLGLEEAGQDLEPIFEAMNELDN